MHRTVLLIDPEPMTEHVLSRPLRMAGYEVVVAGDAEQGLAYAQRLMPAAVVVDEDAVPWGGVGFAKVLFETAGLRHTPVLLLCNAQAWLRPGEVARTSIRRIIRRPLDVAEVLGALRETFAGRLAA